MAESKIQSGEMAFVEHTAAVDFSTWRLFQLPEAPESWTLGQYRQCGKLLTKTVREALTQYPPELYFPITYASGGTDGSGGAPVSDPVTIYLGLAFGADDERCAYACSLEGIVDDLLENSYSYKTKMIERAEDQAICSKVAARLRELADKIDRACGVK